MTSLPLVVGGLIVDRYPKPRRVLAARRTRPSALAGQWEFPGGKVEPGEDPKQALVRELNEELSISVEIHDELIPSSGSTWPASAGFEMRLFFVTTADAPDPQDGHDEVRWLTATDLWSVPWLASDRDALAYIGLSDS